MQATNTITNITAQHRQMVTDLAKPGHQIVDSLEHADAHLLHMAVGIAGEAGELIEALLLYRPRGIPFDLANAVEELGDSEFYIEGLRQGIGVTRPGILDFGFDKDVVRLVESAVGAEAIVCVYAAQAGHLLDAIKKKVIYRKDLDMERTLRHMANMEFCLEHMRRSLRITWQDTLEGNITKLLVGSKARYASGSYSDAQAQARADKDGVQA